MLLFFSHPAKVAAGCSLGLTLWYSAVLPSLLPFLILSGLLVRTGLFRYLNRIYAPVLGRVFRISDEGCYALLLGFFCGFPMGAKIIADLVRQKLISREEGSYLLGFCNNVSPAFFLNYVCLLKLGFRTVPWSLLLLFYGIPIFYGILSRSSYHFSSHQEISKQASPQRLDFPMLDACIMDGFATVTRLGGYIILFTIGVQFLEILPFSQETLAFLSGFLEISCGIDRICALPSLSGTFKTAWACACAALGGLCILAQTKSVLEGSSLSLRIWLKGRCFTALLTFLLLMLPAAASILPGCWK